MNGDRWNRVERVSFRIRDLSVMKTFSDGLETLLRGNHRQQGDFRIDDIAARVRKRQEPGSRSTTSSSCSRASSPSSAAGS